MEEIKTIQVILSSALMILIWLIQILHYPFFKFIDEKDFSLAMLFHQRAISCIATPLMLLELTIAIYFSYLDLPYSQLVLAMVMAIWLSTFIIQVPLHKKLLKTKDSKLIGLLYKTNWIRTLLWSSKAIVVFVLQNE
jgi:hypothetical protein